MNMREQFAAALRSCPDLPAVVRDGDAWSARLRKRRDGLAQWCDRELIDGTIAIDADDYWIKVDPQTGKVVYWEHYPDIREA